MLKVYFALIIILTLTFTAFSQTPEPTATPIEDDGDVVKISTTLIQVDVTVTDKKGRPIKDLKAQDFEIYENGKKQKISNVTFVSSKSETKTNVKTGKKEFKIEAPAPPKQVKPNEVRRTIALVVDDLSLSFESTHFVKRALRNFVENQMQTGDLVAILKTGSGIGALQQFTSDKNRLYKSIDKIKWNLRGSGGMSVFKPFSSHGGFDLENETGASEANEDVPISEPGFESLRNDFFASGSLGAIQYVVEGMDRLPGRKSVLLFSDGFQIFSRGASKFVGSSMVLDRLTRLVESANRASVVIYTMDTRGLQTLNSTSADDFGSDAGIGEPKGGVAVVQRRISDELLRRRTAFAESQDGINYLAKETGGFAIYNTNDLKGGIKKVLNDQSYYLVAYEPDADTFDAEKQKFNKLEVKVKRDNTKVRYRSGFFGVSDEKFKKPTANLTKDQKLLNALSSPFVVNDINLSLSTIFKGNEENELAVSAYLHINVKDLTFVDTKEGTKKAVFDIYAANFGDNGFPTDQISQTFTVNVKGQAYEEIIRDGLVHHFTLPIKKAGAYQMRLAIRDHANDKVGSASQFIEVPKLKKKRLTLSGIVLDDISYKDWNASLNSNVGKISVDENEAENNLTAMTDTALRKFKRGTVLRYGLEIYNAKKDSANKSQLLLRTRIFRDNKMIFEGKDKPITDKQLAKYKVRLASGAINLGTEMQLGDYILQIIVTDKLAKRKRQFATQFVQFEIIK